MYWFRYWIWCQVQRKQICSSEDWSSFLCKPLVLGSRCLQFVDSVKYLGVFIVASHHFKCSFEDVKLKFFVYLTVSLLRVKKQSVQKLYRCTYSSRIIYSIWRMHVKLCHSVNLIFIDLTIWLFVQYVGFLTCTQLTACVTTWMCLLYPSFLNQGSKDLWINSLIWTIRPILRSLYWSLILFLFSTVLIVFISCMCASVRKVCRLLTNKDSYIMSRVIVWQLMQAFRPSFA